MAKIRDDRLDDAVLRLLDGTDLSGKVGITLQLVTTGADGAPHPSLLSVGEVLAVGPQQLRLALWASSTTTGNLERRPDALVTVVVDGNYYGIQLSARRFPESAGGPPGLAAFHANVMLVHRDEVGYAEITSGITYRLLDAEPVLRRWRRTLDGLRALPEEFPTAGGAS